MTATKEQPTSKLSREALSQKINDEMTAAGYTMAVFAIGPANKPVDPEALLPFGFRLIIDLVPANGQSNAFGSTPRRRPARNGTGKQEK